MAGPRRKRKIPCGDAVREENPDSSVPSTHSWLLQYSTVQYSTVQCSRVEYSTVDTVRAHRVIGRQRCSEGIIMTQSTPWRAQRRRMLMKASSPRYLPTRTLFNGFHLQARQSGMMYMYIRSIILPSRQLFFIMMVLSTSAKPGATYCLDLTQKLYGTGALLYKAVCTLMHEQA